MSDRLDRLQRSLGATPALVAVAVLALALVLLSGCTPSRPSRVYTPDIIGVIEDIHAVPGDRFARDLEIGDEMIRYTKDDPRDLGFTPSTGSLLIYGDDDGNRWIMTRGRTTVDSRECFSMSADGVFDDGTHLIFTIGPHDLGIRLPKGDDLELPPPDETGRYPSSPGGSYCIEAGDGTVTATDLP